MEIIITRSRTKVIIIITADVLCDLYMQGGRRPIDLARYEGQAHIVRILEEADNEQY